MRYDPCFYVEWSGLKGRWDRRVSAVRATEVVPEYVEKYRTAIARIDSDPEGFARAYLAPLRVTPTRWQVW